MNTALFENKEQYLQFIAAWKAASAKRSFSSTDMAAYTLLTGKDLLKAFTPVKNKVKLVNGAEPWGGAIIALNGVAYTLRHLVPTRPRPEKKLSQSVKEWRAECDAIPKIPQRSLAALFSDAVAQEIVSHFPGESAWITEERREALFPLIASAIKVMKEQGYESVKAVGQHGA